MGKKKKDKDKPPTPPAAVSTLQKAIDETPDRMHLDLAGERYDVTETVVLTNRRDLAIHNLVLVGAGLGPDEPCIWLKGCTGITFTDSVIIGSADTGGKWSATAGSKQHGIMAGGTRGLRLRNVTVAHVGADWISLSDKPTPDPCQDFIAEVCWFIRSRRQGFSGAGIDRARLSQCKFTDAQRTLFDFESEGGGASDVVIEDCDIDVGTRLPNAVISIGGASRPGALNEGPFTMRGNRIYGGSLTTNNRSTAELRLEANTEGVDLIRFPKAPDLSAYLP